MEEIDTHKRDGLKKVLIGAGLGAYAFSQLPRAAAATVITDDYISVGGKKYADAYTAVVGKSGNVDYLTSDYASDGAAIQAAIDAVNAAGGGTVLIREGTYTLESHHATQVQALNICILMKSNVILEGVGTGATVLELGDSVGGCVIGFSNIDQYSIQNLAIDGNQLNQTDSGTDGDLSGMKGYSSTFGVLQNLYVHDCKRAGIYNTNCSWGKYTNIYTKNNEREGLIFDSEGYTDAYNIKSNSDMASFAGLAAINVQGGSSREDSNMKIICGTVYKSGGIGFRVEMAKKVYVSGVQVFSCGDSSHRYDGFYIHDSEDVTLECCFSWENYRAGIYANDSERVNITNCTVYDNRYNGADANGHGIFLYDSTYCMISQNRVFDTRTSKYQKYGVAEGGTSDYNRIAWNDLRNNLDGYILKTGNNTVMESNIGYNPVGMVSTPSIPSSEVAFTNTYGYPCMVSIFGGTVTVIALDGLTSGLTSGTFTVPPGGTITLTYSVAPSWRWYGL